MQVSYVIVVKPSGGDRVMNPTRKSLARLWYRQFAEQLDLCWLSSWDVNSPEYSDGWAYEHPKPDPRVGRAVQ